MCNNQLSYAFIAFFSIHVISLLWTEDLNWGLHIIGKEWRLLLFPFLLTIAQKEHVKFYILSFLFGIGITEVASYLIWFEILSPFGNATHSIPTPFISHLSYNPLLAFSIYILLNILLFEDRTSLFLKLITLFFIFTMSINMFISGGRAGQIVFFVMTTLIIVQYFKKDIMKLIFAIAVVLPTIFLLAYISIDNFHKRVNLFASDIQNFEKNPNTSVGLRLTFMLNSIEIIKKNPLIGVGTGDFPQEYQKINDANTPNAITTNQPHNMYLLVLTQTGIFGLISLLYIFYIQIKTAFKNNEFKHLRMALPILFLVIMLSDTYLLGHYTTLFFVYFSSFLYKDFEREKI